ncbi:unnamed protein product [Rotaria sp. Silwood1]|nr:unnamed protein product [Rotaria sp. Silwood1]
MASHPELKSRGKLMPPPLVLCGLPRTGTTLLYNLMACDPACRAPLYIEMIQPVPPLARSDTTGQMQRDITVQKYRETLNACGWAEYQQDMRACHPQFVHEEDLLILYQAGCNWIQALLASHDDNELLMWIENDMNKKFVDVPE